MTNSKKTLSVKNYSSELLGMGVGILIGSQSVNKLGSAGDTIALVIAGALIVAGIVAKKKANQCI